MVEHAVTRLQAAICQTAAAIYEVDGPLLRQRMRLPGRYGGLTLRCGSPEESAAACWASWSTHAAKMPGLVHKLGWAVEADPEFGFAMEASALLRQCGVEVSTSEVALTAPAALAYASGPWCADTPLDELFEPGEQTPTYAAGHHPDEGDDADVWTTLTREEATLSCGGKPAECAVRRKLLARITRGVEAVQAAGGRGSGHKGQATSLA